MINMLKKINKKNKINSQTQEVFKCFAKKVSNSCSPELSWL